MPEEHQVATEFPEIGQPGSKALMEDSQIDKVPGVSVPEYLLLLFYISVFGI